MAILNTISSTHRNGFINSNFDYWQRGTAFNFSGSGGYSADRWTTGGSATGTYNLSRVAFGQQIEVPNNPKYYLRLLASTIVSARDTRQYIEGVGSYANDTVTVSFWGRVVAGTYTAALGFIQNFGTGGSPSSQVIITSQNVTLTSSWAKYTFTFAIPSIVGKTLGTNNNDYLMFYVNTPASGSFDAHFSQFMITKGAQTQDWNLAGTNLQGELAMCQRYYEKSYGPDVNPLTSTEASLAVARAASTSEAYSSFYFTATKRGIPAITIISVTGTAGSLSLFTTNSNVGTGMNVGAGHVSERGFSRINGSASLTANDSYRFHWTADAEL